MKAIILAGGFGTRLKHIVSNVPKPMASVNENPFLCYLMKQLKKQNVDEVIMCVSYMRDKIIDYFTSEYEGIKIKYSIEETPLLTGGAIKKAMKENELTEAFVINGDTFFDIDFAALEKTHNENNAQITLAAKHMENYDRYGTITFDDSGKVTSFTEKKFMQSGFINGGIYVVSYDCFNDITQDKFSFETEVMEKQAILGKVYIKKFYDYFIDIGIENDYYKAQEDFKKMQDLC